MLELSRTVRFCVNDPPPANTQPGQATPEPAPGSAPSDNTFAARPPMQGLGRYYELDVSCRGLADPKTGYFINIKHIDHAVHNHALPLINQALANTQTSATIPLGQLMRDLLDALQPDLRRSIIAITLRLTPTYSLSLRSHDMDHIIIRQRYEFSAAHRLHVPDLSEKENIAVFGKCNNPAGHGHNYQLEVALQLPIDTNGRTANVEQIDAIVNQHAIELLDHKHLNTNVPQFANLNPSVENIVQVIWNMLADRFSKLGNGAALDELKVWETSKTVCTYRGPTTHKAPQHQPTNAH